MTETPQAKFKTREDWLLAATEKLRPLFHHHGYKIPDIRVSCGWPSAKGLASNGRSIGQCWAADAASDGKCQIFISPWLDDVIAPHGVLATHAHELVHATVGVENGHKKPFSKCARAIGLIGKLTATIAGDELLVLLKEIATDLGTYPHAKLDPQKRPTKKQSTRMIKMECGTCGYVARTSRKWLDAAGPCHCPAHGAMKFEEPAEGEDDGGDE